MKLKRAAKQVLILAEKLRHYRRRLRPSKMKFLINGTKAGVELCKRRPELTPSEYVLDEAIRLASEDIYHVLRTEMEEVEAECRSASPAYEYTSESVQARLLSAAYKDRTDNGVSLVALILPELVKAKGRFILAKALIGADKPNAPWRS